MKVESERPVVLDRRVRVDRMTLDDVPEVMAIERDSFTAPWPSSAYRKELIDNRMAHYVVLRRSGLFAATNPSSTEVLSERRHFLSSLLPRTWLSLGRRGGGSMTLAGYAGLWLVVDEAHITTIAVRPEFRGSGLGELLLASMIEASLDINARWLTLEVRVTNAPAQSLYRKYGFHDAGVRKSYYSDNNEDALIMWTDELQGAAFQRRYATLKSTLVERLERSGVLQTVTSGADLPR